MLTFKIETEGKEYYFRAKTVNQAITACEKDYKYYHLYLRTYTGENDNIPVDFCVKKRNKPWWKFW